MATEPDNIDAVTEMIMGQGEAPETEVDEEEDTAPEPEDDEQGEAPEVDEDEGDDSEEGDDEGEDEEGDDEPSRDLYTVTVAGEQRQVPLEELTRSYAGQAKIQQDMQDMAHARKVLADAARQIQQQQAETAQLYERAQRGEFRQAPTPPDPSQFSDRTEYLMARAQYDDDLRSYQQEATQYRAMGQRQQMAHQQAEAERMAQAAQQLREADPDFANPETAKKTVDRIMRTATEAYGFAPEDLGQINDPRVVRALKDLATFHEMKAGRETSKVEPQRSKTMRPRRRNASRATETEKARKAMLKSGDVDTVANYLLIKNAKGA